MLLTGYGRVVWGPVTLVAVLATVIFTAFDWWWAIAPVALVWLAVALFFRDPIRTVPRDLPPGAMLSPADGTVSAVLDTEHHEAVGGPARIVRIFLSLANVHVNRAPCDGEVVAVKHTPGRFLDARTEESARVNQNTLVTLRLDDGELVGVRQVTGKVARRIVCDLAPGDRVQRGGKFGMIRFGSTAELILPRPDDVDVRVAKGDRVKGGLTVLAMLAAAATDRSAAPAAAAASTAEGERP
ncbi:MAG: phosphatidylserine decarboxylase [Planctomycetota bacterium]|jgi:phosphatidylserine decarboxylase